MQQFTAWVCRTMTIGTVLLGLLSCTSTPPGADPQITAPNPADKTSTDPSPSFHTNAPPRGSTIRVNLPDGPQTLPLKLLATIGSNQFNLAIAATPRQQQIGLMLRTELADDEGMIFPFQPARRVGFWMKNTLIPLDMLYIRQGIIQEIKHNVPPCKVDPCPTYPSAGLIDQVIEIRGGLAKERGIQAGDRVLLTPLPNSLIKD